MKRKLLKECPLDKKFPLGNPGGRVTGTGNRGGELFSKNYYLFSVAGEKFEGKGDGLIGKDFGRFVMKEIDYGPQA